MLRVLLRTSDGGKRSHQRWTARPAPTPRTRSDLRRPPDRGEAPTGGVRLRRPLTENLAPRRIAVAEPAADVFEHGEEDPAVLLDRSFARGLSARDAVRLVRQVHAAARPEVVAHAQPRVQLQVLVAAVALVVLEVEVGGAR